MLVLSRKIGERIRIGDDVTLTVVRIQGDKVRLGIEAPEEVAIHREEVFRRLQPGGPGLEEGDPDGARQSDEAADSSLSNGRSER